jgi:hypothetical protein
MAVHTTVARTHRHALEQPNVELDLLPRERVCAEAVHTARMERWIREDRQLQAYVPLDGGAHDLDKGQGDLGVPLLGRLQNNSNQW